MSSTWCPKCGRDWHMLDPGVFVCTNRRCAAYRYRTKPILHARKQRLTVLKGKVVPFALGGRAV